jgi:hypothetical protein
MRDALNIAADDRKPGDHHHEHDYDSDAGEPGSDHDAAEATDKNTDKG